jgi:hypothetical protein
MQKEAAPALGSAKTSRESEAEAGAWQPSVLGFADSSDRIHRVAEHSCLDSFPSTSAQHMRASMHYLETQWRNVLRAIAGGASRSRRLCRNFSAS